MSEHGFTPPHKLTLEDRKLLNLTGVTEIVSFDEETVFLKTSQGDLGIHGQGLQLKNLTLEGGQVTVEGNIAALVYHRQQQEKSWWSRLFH